MQLIAAGESVAALAQLLREQSVLVAVAIAALALLREQDRRRWRLSLNRSLHELRRPLQLLALEPTPGCPGPAPAELAIRALADLDAELNGLRPVPAREGQDPQSRPAESSREAGSSSCEAVSSAVWRWQPAFRALGRPIEGRCTVDAEPSLPGVELARALDNLIANAREHGSGAVKVEATSGAEGTVRLSVTDRGCAGDRGRKPGQGPTGTLDSTGTLGPSGAPSRGNGLAIAEELVARAGGRLELELGAEASTATIELPTRAPGER